jgi:hypothetical protein
MSRVVSTLLLAATFACAQMGSPNPQELGKAFEIFARGQARLTCTVSCSFLNGTKKNLYRSYHDAGDWRPLALEVIRVGYSLDLNYYYLGRSAEGLGLPEAARAYYEIASRRAVDPTFGGGDSSFSPGQACNSYGMNQCSGIVLPRAALEGIERAKRGTAGRTSYENTAAIQSAPLPAPKTSSLDKVAPVIAAPERIEADEQTGTATIRGTVRDDSEVASFTIDGQEVEVHSSGGFEYPRYLRAGEEEHFELVAIDRYGNRSVRKVAATRSEQAFVEAIEFEALDPNRGRAGRRNNQALALVIGIENYKRMPEALYARTDANVFKDFAHQALGVPRGRIVNLLDADADNIGIRDGVRRLRGLIDAKTDLYVYFAGHGFASGKGVPYLLPYDGDARYLDEFVSRDDLFASLAALRARSVTVFLDTCYSGRARTGTVLAKGMRPLVLASSNEGVPEGFTVISAAASDEFSGDLPEVEHGLFSYFLMRGLGGEADSDGDRAITVEELHGYVAGEVSRQAARLGRQQTPEIFGERSRVLVRY